MNKICKTLYCIRHGYALHNQLYKYMGSRAYYEFRGTPLLHEGIEQAKDLNKRWEKIDNIDLSLLLDLSLKHINLYKEIDENNNENIDEKINNIFMNYTLVINLLKKQINHLRNIILEIKQEVLNKCGNIDELMGNVETGQKQANCENELSFF